MSGYWKIGFIFSWSMICFFGGYRLEATIVKARNEATAEESLKKTQLKQIEDNAKAATAESQIAAIQHKYETILRDSANENPASNCKLPDSWVQNINQFTSKHPAR